MRRTSSHRPWKQRLGIDAGHGGLCRARFHDVIVLAVKRMFITRVPLHRGEPVAHREFRLLLQIQIDRRVNPVSVRHRGIVTDELFHLLSFSDLANKKGNQKPKYSSSALV